MWPQICGRPASRQVTSPVAGYKGVRPPGSCSSRSPAAGDCPPGPGSCSRGCSSGRHADRRSSAEGGGVAGPGVAVGAGRAAGGPGRARLRAISDNISPRLVPMRDGWGFVRDGPLPSGVREGATTVLSVPPASSCPGFLSAGALSARLACTWASARETGVHLGFGARDWRAPGLRPGSGHGGCCPALRAPGRAAAQLWRGGRGRCSSWPPVTGDVR